MQLFASGLAARSLLASASIPTSTTDALASLASPSVDAPWDSTAALADEEETATG